MNTKVLLTLCLVSAVAASCYRSPNDTIFEEDLDMVITNYSKAIDYGAAYETFQISDSFALASNTENIDVADVNSPAFTANIKAAIVRNMEAYGYTFQTNITDTPDIYIPVTIMYINTKGMAYYPIYYPGYGYGWGYPSYGYGGYYYYYSWSYIPTYYSYNQGSVLIDWIDIKNRKPPFPGDSVWRTENVWNMGISGLAGSRTENERNDRISAAIDVAFKQSPYLNQ